MKSSFSEDKNQQVDLSQQEGQRLAEMRLALSDWLARELKGEHDLLHSMVPKGGWARAGVSLRRILQNRPGLLLKDPCLRKILVDKFGTAVDWLKELPTEEQAYYPGV